MFTRNFILLIFLAGSHYSCDSTKNTLLEDALTSKNPAISRVMQNQDAYEIQIRFSAVEFLKNGKVAFNENQFKVDPQSYFYPASTVKLPVAVLALEYIDGLETLEITTPYITARDTLIHTIKEDVIQILAVSDNEAYNRLYELLGRDYINTRLRQKGIEPVRIAHRLSTPKAAEAQRLSLSFLRATDTLVLGGDRDLAIAAIQPLDNLYKGIGYIHNEELVTRPMDFSTKNYFPIDTQVGLLKRIFFPKSFLPKEQFQLKPETLTFLRNAMQALPRSAGYEPETYYDSYGKFFIYGDTKEPIPSTIKIYNKVGYAYGTLTDTAYISDEENNVHFLLSATILVNENEVFNDDQYEYDAIGIPFLAALGREIYYQMLQKKQ